MKNYTPPQELLDLDLVLKYDTEQTATFSLTEKSAIKYKRAKIMAGLAYSLNYQLAQKIQFTLKKIEAEKWQPQNPIQYN